MQNQRNDSYEHVRVYRAYTVISIVRIESADSMHRRRFLVAFVLLADNRISD